MSLLGEALFTRTQRQVLGLFYSRPDRSFYTREVLRRTRMGVATIKRELDRMELAGILTKQKVGNQIHYQANPGCVIYDELVQIVRKAFDVGDVLGAALKPLIGKIHYAFVFGGVASGTAAWGDKVDLLIIGDVSLPYCAKALYAAEEALGWEIHPKIYGTGEWMALLDERDKFVSDVLSNPRIDLVGDSLQMNSSPGELLGQSNG